MEQTTIKITDEELNKIKNLQVSYGEKTLALGDLRVQRILAQQRWQELDNKEKQLVNDVVQLQTDEKVLISELTEKYGPGSIDMKTGMFVTKVDK